MDRSASHSRHGSESRRTAMAGDEQDSMLGAMLDVSLLSSLTGPLLISSVRLVRLRPLDERLRPRPVTSSARPQDRPPIQIP